MASKNTTLNLPEALIARTRAYAAAHGTTMTAIVRSHLEAITAEPDRTPDDPLRAYAQGLIRSDEAVDRLGVRDYADLLVTLGDAGLSPPRPPEHQIENEAVTFARIWLSA
ncbi:MAG: hypothetical protein OXF66_10410 [Gammaproteobacteria bacterium]|nr:hypothetical protein [Gammaproteobacteria bacterium]MCY4166355.1 hypothetical protein [Gammaproteobacteria bacterium]